MAVTFCRSEIRLVASALPNTVPNMLLSRGHTGDVMPSLMSESEQVMFPPTGGPKCAGVIVFHYGVPSLDINSDEKILYVVVVKKAKQLPYPWGFPKGGREGNETVLENAIRELREETGIVDDQLHILNDSPVKEYHKGILTVLYYVAKFVGDPWKHEFTYSDDELETACWMPVRDVQKAPVSTGMKPGRLDTLKRTVVQFEEILHKNCAWM